jgi:hypothetical protein
MNRTASDERTAGCRGGQFRNGHTNGHKHCSFRFLREWPWKKT